MELDKYTLAWLDNQDHSPSEDERTRERIDVHDKSIRMIAETFQSLGIAGSTTLAEQVLRDERKVGGSERISYAQLAAASAILAGEAGIEMLSKVAVDVSYKSWASYGIEALWLAASGNCIPAQGYAASTAAGISFDVTSRTRAKAREALDELIVRSKEDRALSAKVLELASAEARKNQIVGGDNDFTEHIMKVLAAGSIAVPVSLLDDFEALISQDLLEERYQEFLKMHPTVLDPLAAEIIPKHRLGDDYVTDFVIRRHDLRYLVVEIEKPQNRIFNQKDDFTSDFSHALGQVLDFLGWVADNGDYARKKLQGIENPRGLIVIGRRSELTARQEVKLRRWCANSKSIEVATYDDLVTSGRQLLSSLRSLIE